MTTMHRKRVVHAILAAAFIAGTLCTGSAFAADEEAPNPLKELKSSVKELMKRSQKAGYSASVEIRGGTSKKANHEIETTSIYENYSGDIRNELMFVPSMQAYRVHDKGAVYDGERWAMLQARKEGKELDRLFMFPLRVLTTAMKNAEKVSWLESTEKPPEPTVTEKESGRTSVTRELTQEQIYHRMRVELPNEVAVQVFTDVQNSGCLGGG